MIVISIVLPVYNKEKYICNILEDLQKQTFQNFECIIVDDGSTDRSGIISDEICSMDDRFRVIHIENGGVSHARNVGLELVRGKYITFVDADDRVEVEYLEQLYNDIKTSKSNMVISGIEKWWENQTRREIIELPYYGKYNFYDLIEDFAKVQQKTGIYGICCGKLFQKKLLEGVKFTDGLKLAEDFDFFLHIYPKIDTIFFDTNCCYQYLQEADNSSVVLRDDEIDYMAQLKINLRYREFFKKMDAYRDENSLLVNKLLTNYAFFVVFHAKRQEVQKKVEQMHLIMHQENISFKGSGILQNIILRCIKRKKGICAQILLRIYDIARSFRRK